MPDAADSVIQNIKDANPVSAMVGAAKGIAAKVENEVEGAPAVLMQRPQAQAQFVNQHKEADNQGLLREYYQQHPEFASADPIRAKRLGIEPPPQQQAQPAQNEETAPRAGQHPSQLSPGQQQKTPQAWGQEQQAVEGTSGSEVEETTGDKAVDFGASLPGSAVAAGAEAVGVSPQHAQTAGNVLNLGIMGAGIIRAGVIGGAALYGLYKFAETPEQLAIAAENARLGAGEVTPQGPTEMGAGEAAPPKGPTSVEGEPAPRKVTPETMYTTGTEAPGKDVTPEKPKALPSPEEPAEAGEEGGPVAAEGGKAAAQGAAPASAGQPESVGAAALTSKRDMAEDMSVAHTMPDLIARAHETPLSKEEFNGFKVSPDSETGHPTLTEPVNMVDALRISHYAGQQVGALQDAAKSAQAAIDSGAEDAGLTKAFIQKTAEVRDEVLPVWSGMRHQIGLALKVLGRPTSDMRNLLLNTRDLLSEVDYSQPGQLMNKLANLKPEDQTAMLAKINQPNFWEHLSTLWQAQKLGLNTALKKWSSDAMMTVYQPMERYAAAAYSQTLGTGEVTFAQANAYLRGGISAIQDGMKIGRASERANKPLFDSQMGFGEAAHKALGSAGTRLEGTWLGHAYDLYANLIHELGGRRILYPDQTAKYIHYTAERHALAMEAAENEVGAGTSAQRQAAYEHFLDNPTKDMQEKAFDYARAQTFSSSMQQLKWVQDFRKTPAGRILLPFFPTPVNILSRGVQGVGLGPLTAQWRGMYAAGGAQRDLAMARNGLGLLMAGTLVHHWMAGRINGAPPTNPDMRKLWTASGHQPYSIELGNHTLGLGNLPEPIGDMLGLVADTANTAQQMPVDYDDPNTGILHQRLDNVGNSLTMALMGQIHNASFFRTLSDVVHFIGDDKSAPADRIGYLRDLAGGVVPTVATDIAHWWDPIHREIRGNLDQLKSEVPGVSKTLPSDVDLFGRDAVYPLGSAGMSLDLLSSPKATGIEHDPVTDELLRLQPTVPAAPKAIGGPNRGPMSQDNPRYGTPLTPDEQHAFKVIRGQLKDDDGKDMHGALAEMMNGKGYKDANDIVRRQMIDEVFTQRQGMAREFLQEKSTNLQQRVQHRQEQRQQMMGAQ